MSVDAIGKSKKFRRMTFSERGHAPNRWSLWPINKIEISESQIVFTTRFKRYSYCWTDIESAVLVKKPKIKGYGIGGGRITTKTLSMRAEGKVFVFDVSPEFPDFERNDELLRLIKNRVSVQCCERKDYSQIWYFAIVVIVSLALIYFD